MTRRARAERGQVTRGRSPPQTWAAKPPGSRVLFKTQTGTAKPSLSAGAAAPADGDARSASGSVFNFIFNKIKRRRERRAKPSVRVSGGLRPPQTI